MGVLKAVILVGVGISVGAAVMATISHTVGKKLIKSAIDNR